MLTLSPTETIRAIAGNANQVALTICGMELNTGTESYKVLAQSLIAASTTTYYTAPSSTQSFIKTFFLTNVSGSAQTVRVYIGGTANGNAASVSFTLPAAGFATMQEDGWKVYDSDGCLVMKVTNSSLALWPYKYSVTTANSDPTSGYFSFDLAPPTTSCVRMNLSKTNSNGILLGTLFDLILKGTARVVLQNPGQTALMVFNVTSLVNQTNYYELTGTCSQQGITFGTNQDDVYYLNVSAPVNVDVQTFTASGTWTKPVGGQMTLWRGWGSGASGGGGRRDASSAARGGGSGGSGGALQERMVPCSLLGSTEVVTVGGATTGGAGSTVNGVSGSDGSDGNVTSVGTAPSFWLRTPPAGKGTGGSATSVARGSFNTAFLNGLMYPGCDGGIGEITGVASSGTMSANASNPVANLYRGGGGGGGGGAGNGAAVTTNQTGGTGGRPYATTSVATGGSTNNPGTNGINASDGGGGGGSGAIAGGNGGDGAAPGGGGGGGGAGTAANGGNGGAGARGEVRAYTLCAA